MRILALILIALAWNVTVHAEQASVLTELEKLQEKVWYLQRDVTKLQTSLDKRLQQVEKTTSVQAGQQRDLGVRLENLSDEMALQQEQLHRVAEDLDALAKSMAGMASRAGGNDTVLTEQAKQLDRLHDLVGGLQKEVAAVQAGRGQSLDDLRTQSMAMATELETMRQELARLEKQQLYWGSGLIALVILALAVGFAVLKSREPAM